MRKLVLLVFSLLVLSIVPVSAPPPATAIAAPPPQPVLAAPGGLFAPPADQFCTILCTVGHHCCIVGGNQVCISNGVNCVAS